MKKYLEPLKLIESTGAKAIIIHPKYPDALLYVKGDGTTAKITLSEETVNELELMVKADDICDVVVENGLTWIKSKLEEGNSVSEVKEWVESYIERQRILEESQAKKEEEERIRLEEESNPQNYNSPSKADDFQLEDELSQTESGEEEEPPLEDEESNSTLSDEELYGRLLDDIHKYMSKRTTSLKISINDVGNILDNGVVIKRNNSSNRVSALKKILKTNNATGYTRTVSIEDTEYKVVINSIASHSTIDVFRVLDDEKYTINSNKELTGVINDKTVGSIIASTYHPVLALEPVLRMLEGVDPECKENLLAVGNPLPEIHNVPSVDAREIPYSKIKTSPYRYIMFGPEVELKMTEVLDLVLGGKIVVLSHNSSTLYGLMTKFDLQSKESEKVYRQLMLSVVCFINPLIRMKREDGVIKEVTPADTELYHMNRQRSMEIIDKGISMEEFNVRIEYPAKVYGLTSKVSKISQEDEFINLLKDGIKNRVSDIFIAAGSVVKFRINGTLIPYSNVRITPEVSKQVMFLLTTEEEREGMKVKGYIDTSYAVPGLARFRLHLCLQRGTHSIIIRPVNFGIPTKEEMGIPDELVKAITSKGKGMVITTGATGMGKSTTNAILVDNAFRARPQTLVSIGDPIEYLYQHHDGIVIQREIPSDAPDFETALESVFRSNPNIIEVGELRNKSSVEVAMRIGSSGHLFFSTLHTGSIMATIHSILNRSDPERRGEVVESLSESLTAIINQELIDGVDGEVIPVFEYLIIDDYAKSCLAKDDLTKLEKYLIDQASSGRYETVSLREYELQKLLRANLITEETYERHSRKSDRGLVVGANSGGN